MLKCKSIVAGFLIGLGVIINTLAASPILGAGLFSFGLLMIIDLQLPLYTGQIGFISQRKKIDLLNILIYNFIGIFICVYSFAIVNQNFYITLYEKAISKFDKTYLQMFVCGFICGTLIHFAVKSKKQLMTVMAVMIFILIGAEHCIADFPYYIININLTNTIKMLLVILGNSCGAIFIEKLLTKGSDSNAVCGTHEE